MIWIRTINFFAFFMKTKLVFALMTACFGLLVFPLAVAFHRHLYADGAYFLAQLLETGRIAVAGRNPLRFFHHVITQLPAVLALKSGVFSPSAVSRIYGATLFYLPLLLYLAAAWLLARAGMKRQMLVLALMYCLLAAFTSFFIISESHLASALFVLMATIICVCNLAALGPLFALLVIGAIGLSCYEFWAVYFPVALVLFAARTWRRRASLSRKILYACFVLLCLAGFAANAVGLVFIPRLGVTRGPKLVPHYKSILSMFTNHFLAVWAIIIIACLFFAGYVLYIRFRAGHELAPRPGKTRFWRRLMASHEACWLVAGFLVMACSAAAMFTDFPIPENAYALRLLNLFLPLMYAASFFPSGMIRPPASARTAMSDSADGDSGAAGEGGDAVAQEPGAAAVFVVLAVLALAVQTQIHNTARWREFTSSFLDAAQADVEYVELEDADIRNSSLLWGWTTPTMSVLLQGLAGKPVRSVIFNPAATADGWEPYGPLSRQGKRLAEVMGVPFDIELPPPPPPRRRWHPRTQG